MAQKLEATRGLAVVLCIAVSVIFWLCMAVVVFAAPADRCLQPIPNTNAWWNACDTLRYTDVPEVKRGSGDPVTRSEPEHKHKYRHKRRHKHKHKHKHNHNASGHNGKGGNDGRGGKHRDTTRNERE